jgi:hypothetical protein
MVPSPWASARAPDPAVAGDVLGVGTGGGHCLDPRASPLVCDLVSQWLGAPSLHPGRASSPPCVSAGSGPALRPRSICWISRYRQAGPRHPALWMALQWELDGEPDAPREALCQDILGAHLPPVVTQASASAQCKRAVESRRATGTPLEGAYLHIGWFNTH